MSAESKQSAAPVCAVRGLGVTFHDGGRAVRALENVDFLIRPGERVALVGDSGSGKSTLALAIVRLLPARPACVVQGEVRFEGRDVMEFDDATMRAVRGAAIGTVFQDPASALNPVMRVGDQVAEVWTAHEQAARGVAQRRATAALERVGLGAEAARAFPHELSGGMRQRVQIAMAVALRPRLLILDEPTTALDTVTQAEVLTLIEDLRREIGCAVLLVTHDLALAHGRSDRVVVMSHGRVVSDGAPAHAPGWRPATPTVAVERPLPRGDADVILAVRGLVVAYPRRDKLWRRSLGPPVVDGVSFDVVRGECLAIVGNSGSGKTTLARALLRLIESVSGRVTYRADPASAGVDLRTLAPHDLRRLRPDLGLVFQDPSASLNPRRTAREVLREALNMRAIEDGDMSARLPTLLAAVGLEAIHLDRLPHQLSGGERQRLCLARALATEPRLLVLDEALSSLDEGHRARALALLARMRVESGLACVFVTHDLGSVENSADRVAVLSHGRIVEIGATSRLFAHPEHADTRALLAARP